MQVLERRPDVDSSNTGKESPDSLEIRPFGAPVVETLVTVQDALPQDPTELQALHKQVTMGLDDMRNKINGMTNVQLGDLDEYLDEMPSKLRDILGAPQGALGLAGWLRKADNVQLTGFLTWHGDRLREQQSSPQFERETKVLKRAFVNGVFSGINQEVFDPSAAEDLGERVASGKVYKGDAFDMIISNARGYYVPGTNYIVVNPTDTSGPEDRRFFYHESGHKDLMLLPGLFDEPTNDLASIGIDNGGDFSIERLRDRGAYPIGKNFLYNLCTGGRDQIDIRLFTRAGSARGKEARSKTWGAVATAVDQSWALKGQTDIVTEMVEISNREASEYIKQGVPISTAWEKAAANMNERILAQRKMLMEQQAA